MNKAISSGLILAVILATGGIVLAAKPPVKDALPATDKLVVYSPNSDGLLKATIPAFEKKYGVKVEVVSAGTGELFKRLQGEANSPYADVVFGGAYATYVGNKPLFQPYTSANNGKVMKAYRNTTGYITPYCLDGSLILINKKLIGAVKIRGYKDLLNPALKGKIVAANPTASSSAFCHLTNMLNAIGKGNYESPEAWDFVKALFANCVVIGSSSAVWKGVRDGEYTVGLTYEDPSVQLIRDGADVKVVYMKEGVVFLPAGAGIVKGAKNLANARRFIDFITSREIQNAYSTTTTSRPVMAGVTTPSYMAAMQDIKVLREDMDYVEANRAKIVAKFKDIYTDMR
jgi:iron(III) transport system substrate-binding protein